MTIKFRIGREHLEHEDPAVRRDAAVARDAILDFLAALDRYAAQAEAIDLAYKEETEPAPAKPRPNRTGEQAAHRRRTAEIRAWARENGFPVTGTGRFPRALVEAYDAAHPQEAEGE